MHLIMNLSELLISHWRGTIPFDRMTDSKLTWDWATLTGDTWIQHGKLVATATQYFPSSFHHPPRNPAEKISSGYKATEWYLYIFGLGPGFFRTFLPRKYWRNFCKLVHGIRAIIRGALLQSRFEKPILFSSNLWRNTSCFTTNAVWTVFTIVGHVFIPYSISVQKSPALDLVPTSLNFLLNAQLEILAKASDNLNFLLNAQLEILAKASDNLQHLLQTLLRLLFDKLKPMR